MPHEYFPLLDELYKFSVLKQIVFLLWLFSASHSEWNACFVQKTPGGVVEQFLL